MADAFEESNIQEILETVAKNQGYKQPKFNIDCGTRPGENFVCRIYRVVVTESVNAKEKSNALIFKVSLPNRKQQIKLSSDLRFRLESEMYQIILPKLNTLLKTHGIANGLTFPGTARCFGVELNHESNSVIILEDLKPQGYGIVDIKIGLDDNQCRLVLEKLALLHSSSMALEVLEPETAKHFRKMLQSTPWRDGISEDLLMDFQRAASTGLDSFEKENPIFNKLREIQENFRHEFRILNSTPEDIACITHGDCWSNNLLFKFDDDGKPNDLCIVDFQTPGYNSPVIDVVVVLIECTTKETRDEHYQKLLKYYYDEMATNLRLMGCDSDKLFSWETFQKHLKFYGRIGVVWSLVGLPTHMTKATLVTDDSLRNLSTGTGIVTNPESIKKLRKRLTEIVADAAQWGYI